MIVAIDCGTTNSRVYGVDGKGTVLGRGSRKVGVRDTSITGSRAVLQAGLREAFDEALSNADIGLGKVRCILSNGMITSEIGLKELPHLEAPVSIESLAQHIEEVGDLGVFPPGIPVYFIRGIKNRIAGTAGRACPRWATTISCVARRPRSQESCNKVSSTHLSPSPCCPAIPNISRLVPMEAY